ncbi:ATP-dependent Clp protease ATP-binding subunit ClpC [Sinomonas atrocyanea]|uniref:ATP-dependent Clp protease ATP-binding subunit n=1 Tax=Sinomonas atrocyanea TaxID=37927 RepID=UPI00278A4314|nr:ATP-dependent Clp protease ATP-binding subunit [Sinomonas atrocyanea]MDP9882696.1 ATP-dependent Clp protease ATP-binding subunit ClpC [Sinomonas atrocyanea]
MPLFFGPAAGNGSFDEFLARYLQGQGARRPGRPIDMTRLVSRGTQTVLTAAGRYAREHGHREVDALHLLRALTETEQVAAMIAHAGADPAEIAASAEERLPGTVGGDLNEADGMPSLTTSAQHAFLDAYKVARSVGSTYIDPEHLFLALVLNSDAASGQILAAAGVTPQSLQDGESSPAAADPADDAGPSPRAAKRPLRATAAQKGRRKKDSMLEQFGTDLTALAREGRLDPVIGRAAEIEQAIEILARRTKNNPVLIGEAGVGKTAIVEGLAQAVAAGDVPAQIAGTTVISLDLPAMLAGTRYRGDFEERLTKTMDEIAEDGNIIAFVDEIHTVVGAGGGGEGGMDAGNILKSRLARGELHLVGATTLDEYRKIEKDPALERRFQPVTVGEPSVEDAVAILEGLKDRYEEHHGVTYAEDAIRAAVELSHRYITDRHLPDKAIDLIDQAGARLSLARGPRVDLEALGARVAELTAQKEAAIAREAYEEASRLRDEIDAIAATIEAEATGTPLAATAEGGDAGGSRPDAVVREADIAAVVARATGIPAARLTEGERERLARLEDELHERVVGQEDAVTVIAKSVRRNRTGLGDANRPVGSFLFLGPTGVGKTELAKTLAASLFGDESAMVRFDMSEFGERHTISRLVGAPPGYVGYSEAGQLTERVRRHPYSVVLLDEVEKAHPDVFNLLLQVLDDGRLTDGQGHTVDFRNTVVIMTSNLGSEFLATRGAALGFAAGGAEGGPSETELRARVMGRLRETMRPEFLNRIDEIVLFRKLTREQLHDIVRLQLRGTEARLAAQGIALAVDEAAVDWIADRGYEPEFGARPLRRVIQRELEDRVADLLVTGAVADGGRVTVGVSGSAPDGGAPFGDSAHDGAVLTVRADVPDLAGAAPAA